MVGCYVTVRPVVVALYDKVIYPHCIINANRIEIFYLLYCLDNGVGNFAEKQAISSDKRMNLIILYPALPQSWNEFTNETANPAGRAH